ncbi:asparagine synthase (glutamine-hydrolysing) [Nonomuraea polychroma]|uniref:asparagine synthase (glutamine-hydrolyzing) n=1 Tax=Nonomuraea polychroma TaxID=46176 RepID=A0A438MEK1_9ACTN|nr:asparagine synthase (glutamine-hydrolyzing) [Nonomuraea polychroma]RVX44147.1 asparagine synthase (glutamine-hydrolysing) [Nonomuraea polychroma]
MCGIAGHVDFERDLTGLRDTAAAMAETMTCRGPDAGGLWAQGHAALAHRRLAVIDLAGSAQPMVVEEDGRRLAALTYNGEIYNYRELRAELRARGHRFRTEGDTEVVLRAYLEWGDDVANHLNGIFAFAVWDPRDQSLLLVRDHFGVKPLFYGRGPDGELYFASEPKALMATGRIEARADADSLREAFSQVWTPGRTVFAGIEEVRPGHIVRVTRSGLRHRRYWALESRPHTDDLPTTVDTIRGMLEEIIGAQLVADVPVGSLLSGGLDSSVMTALAARHRGARGEEPIRSFSVTFTRYTERFRADEVRDTPDAPFARMVAQHVKSLHTPVVITPERLAEPGIRRATVLAQDRPSPLGDMDASLYELFAQVREHSTVALCGEGADEVFGGYHWAWVPELIDVEAFPWIAFYQYFCPGAGLGSGLLDEGLLKQLDLEGYSADRYREAVAEVPRLAGEPARERRMREITHLHLTRWMQHLLTRDDRISMAVGLEVRVPYVDPKLVEYVFNTPWSMKSHDGREKALLRAAGADLLPEDVLSRQKSPFPVTQDPLYTRYLSRSLTEILDDPTQPAHELIDIGAARSVLAAPEKLENGPIAWVNRTHIEMVLTFNAWLQHYGVRLDIP